MVSISSIVWGTWPPKSAMILRAAPISDLALVVEESRGPDIVAQLGLIGRREILDGGIFLEQPGRHFVDHACRCTAPTGWWPPAAPSNCRWSKGTVGWGYISSRIFRILRTRAARSAAVLGRGTSLGGVALGALRHAAIIARIGACSGACGGHASVLTALRSGLRCAALPVRNGRWLDGGIQVRTNLLRLVRAQARQQRSRC